MKNLKKWLCCKITLPKWEYMLTLFLFGCLTMVMDHWVDKKL